MATCWAGSAALTARAWAYVLYKVGGDQLWHQRHVLSRLVSSETEVVVLTPDLDVYVEQLLDDNEDVIAVRFSGATAGGHPPRLGVPLRTAAYSCGAWPRHDDSAGGRRGASRAAHASPVSHC